MSTIGSTELYGVGGLFETINVNRREKSADEERESSPLSTRDTVSISSEALEKWMQMQSVQEGGASPNGSGLSQEETDEEDNAEDSSAADDLSNALGSSDTIESLEKQIQQLQQKMAEVAASSEPESVKQGKIESYQSTIAALQQQINELKQASSGA